MWTITDPKSTRTQCDAAVPSRPIGLVFSSRRLPMIPSAMAASCRSEPPEQIDEVVGHRGQAGEVEQDDVGRLLVLGQLDDPAGELEWREPPGRRDGRALGQAVGARRGRGIGRRSGHGGFGHDQEVLRVVW